MTLGELLAVWQDEATIMDALISLDDLALLSRLQDAAAEEGSDIVTIVREGVGRFVQFADDDAWVTLMGRLGKSDDPARVGLKMMLEFGLSNRNAGQSPVPLSSA